MSATVLTPEKLQLLVDALDSHVRRHGVSVVAPVAELLLDLKQAINGGSSKPIHSTTDPQSS